MVRKVLFWLYILGFYFVLHFFNSVPYVYLYVPLTAAILLGIGAVIAIGITLVPAIKPFRKNKEGSDRRFVLSLIYSFAVLSSYILLLLKMYASANF